MHLSLAKLRQSNYILSILCRFCKNCERRQLFLSCLSVYPSAWNNSASNGRIFKKCFDEIQISLKYDKNNGYFTCRSLYIYVNISLNSSYNYKCFRQSRRENQSTTRHCISFLPKIVSFLR